MKANRIRQAAAAGRVPVGHMLMEFGTSGIAKLCAFAELDFVLIDMEHGPFGIRQVAELIANFKAAAISPIVRVPASEYDFVARVMDCGAHGVMAPNVCTAAQARRLNAAMRYAPAGERGLGLGAAHNDFVPPDDPAAYMQAANARNLLICQIESRAALDNLEAIAQTPGVDCLWVGHMDLTHSMGIVGQFRHADFLAALRRVSACAKANGLFAGIQPGDLSQAAEWLHLGFDLISFSADIGVYRSALRAGAEALRASSEKWKVESGK